MSPRKEVFFDSGGVRCAADLYWPDHAQGPVPCVVMGHGASGTKRLALPAYAAKFTACGMAVLAFDYRGWGASEGRPRQVIDTGAQREDYRAAIRYARAQPGIDPDRVALWGTSYSGGHVLDVAADDPRVAAVVSQVPFIDARQRGRLRRALTPEKVVRLLRFTIAAIRDTGRARRGRPPLLVPVVADPWRLAVFTDAAARAALLGSGGEATGWRNAIAPRAMFTLPRYRAGTADRLTMPVLMCLAEHDTEGSSEFADRLAARMADATVLRYPLGHFDVYLAPHFGPISDAQARFLQQALRPSHLARSTGSSGD
ncbi:alpha/beta fold hydrolase [Nonomuraea maheshkhaliensis]|uniref:Alpha/beta fold hydrolase n=1 Tax=Nonomuraea maheshkhaliensis TaxID=419590 RepID=A0ABP4RJS2_9ACTN